jgi:hypothetical protein
MILWMPDLAVFKMGGTESAPDFYVRSDGTRIRMGGAWPTDAADVSTGEVYSDGGVLTVK